tara:strand:+ start:298 stop:711 length:414 start_codon:yes stop_codon:yes gene_type:complete
MYEDLEFFKESEFREWSSMMNPKILPMLDEFRRRWKRRCSISKHPDALGRYLEKSHSQHNLDRFEFVNAADIFPSGLKTSLDCECAYEVAKDIGFTGIGIYLDTKQGIMMHLDVRDAPLAKWARVDGEYVSIERAFE